jgi:hypothetical protein
MKQASMDNVAAIRHCIHQSATWKSQSMNTTGFGVVYRIKSVPAVCIFAIPARLCAPLRSSQAISNQKIATCACD